MRPSVEDIIEAMAPLAGLPNPGRPITREMVRVWAEVLSDLPLDRIRHAVRQALGRERYYPPPAVLRDYAVPPRDLAAEAARVYAALGALERYDPHRGGYWIEAEIRDHLGRAAAEAHVAAGGSPARLREDDTWTRKAFGEAYAAAARSGEPPVLPPPATLRSLTRAPYRPLSPEVSVRRLVAGTAKALSAPVSPRAVGRVPGGPRTTPRRSTAGASGWSA